MSWRERIEEAAQKRDEYANMLRGGSSRARAVTYAVRCMVEDVAEDVHRELNDDSDPVALASRHASLTLLLAYLSFKDVVSPDMTGDEIAAVLRK